jgi:hypothetical protein
MEGKRQATRERGSFWRPVEADLASALASVSVIGVKLEPWVLTVAAGRSLRHPARGGLAAALWTT